MTATMSASAKMAEESWQTNQAIRGYSLGHDAYRLRALELAVEIAKVNPEKANGQSVIRMALGFNEFLTGKLNKKDSP